MPTDTTTQGAMPTTQPTTTPTVSPPPVDTASSPMPTTQTFPGDVAVGTSAAPAVTPVAAVPVEQSPVSNEVVSPVADSESTQSVMPEIREVTGPEIASEQTDTLPPLPIEAPVSAPEEVLSDTPTEPAVASGLAAVKPATPPITEPVIPAPQPTTQLESSPVPVPMSAPVPPVAPQPMATEMPAAAEPEGRDLMPQPGATQQNSPNIKDNGGDAPKPVVVALIAVIAVAILGVVGFLGFTEQGKSLIGIGSTSVGDTTYENDFNAEDNSVYLEQILDVSTATAEVAVDETVDSIDQLLNQTDPTTEFQEFDAEVEFGV